MIFLRRRLPLWSCCCCCYCCCCCCCCYYEEERQYNNIDDHPFLSLQVIVVVIATAGVSEALVSFFLRYVASYLPGRLLNREEDTTLFSMPTVFGCLWFVTGSKLGTMFWWWWGLSSSVACNKWEIEKDVSLSSRASSWKACWVTVLTPPLPVCVVEDNVLFEN